MIRRIDTTAKVFLSIACMGLSLQFVFAGEIYRWVDENGIVNYGERVPQGKTATEVKPDAHKLGTISTGDVTNEAKPGVEIQPVGDMYAKSAAEISKEREDNCTIARDNIGRLESGISVRVAGEDADPKLLDAQQRQTWLQHSKEAEAEYCD